MLSEIFLTSLGIKAHIIGRNHRLDFNPYQDVFTLSYWYFDFLWNLWMFPSKSISTWQDDLVLCGIPNLLINSVINVSDNSRDTLYISMKKSLRLRWCILTPALMSKSSSKLEQYPLYAILNAYTFNFLISWLALN